MKRWFGWTIVLGLGGALATGCVSRETENAKQVGRPSTPIQEKYKSPSASEAQSGGEALGGQGGSGGAGLTTPEHWQGHPDSSSRESEGPPYILSAPRWVPPERRPAPLGVGSGPDNARKQALDQLKDYMTTDSR
ncbi:hypothetical protein [Vitiosangium sp. GDMCC 1.1324]|uniref:hypothetical protein n=1 Tax=Vitiosangium sp. (strain GDMCC 1.1324) TaxID=2138576 RepID=UPI000D3B03B5|nr:hypothetical protein [Vitiosangium sp. GDMCC 1.1324]PTL81348.1 hypothetical protein DAT35_24875 [Vitiosangium sp. GDMCC 1.1324]